MGQHGVFEWQYYEPQVDELIAPLMFSYMVAYFDKLGFMCHRYGPGSQHSEAEADMFLLALERHFFGKLDPAGRTLAILTADHGAMETDLATTIYLARAGNLVILPYTGESVSWYEKDRHEQRLFGHHGGLTPQEMEIPLLAIAI